MNKIVIAGLGPGSKDYILPITIKKIEEADIVIGAKRNLQSIWSLIEMKEILEINGKLEEIVKFIRRNNHKKILIVLSGDTGFYSMLKFMNKNFASSELEVITGISSMQYLFSKISKPWQDAKLASLHHKDFDYIKALEKYDLVGLLTDKDNNPQKIAQKLYENNCEYKIILGENLSYTNEKISYYKPSTLKDSIKNFQINVVIIDKRGD